jgi:hypothetical protein
MKHFPALYQDLVTDIITYADKLCHDAELTESEFQLVLESLAYAIKNYYGIKVKA